MMAQSNWITSAVLLDDSPTMAMSMERINKIVFNPESNYVVSYRTFWLSIVAAPATMIGRGLTEGFDLFEQVMLAISWYAIIETARNSVITSLIARKDDR